MKTVSVLVMQFLAKISFLMVWRWSRITLLVFGALACFGQPVITTIAGSDVVFPSPIPPALMAPFGQLHALAVDRDGNIYAADTASARVFRIAPEGVVTVAAGNGIVGFSG